MVTVATPTHADVSAPYLVIPLLLCDQNILILERNIKNTYFEIRTPKLLIEILLNNIFPHLHSVAFLKFMRPALLCNNRVFSNI